MTFWKRVEFKIKAGFFAAFQWMFKKGGRHSIPLDGKNIKRVLFLRPDRIGDTVCSFPLIDHMKRLFPDMQMSIYASTKNVGLIKEDPRFKSVYIYRRNIINDILQVMAIRKKSYDLLVDLMGADSVTTLFLSQFSVANAPRIGVNKKKYRKYYDFTFIQPDDCTDHTIDLNLQLLNAFGIEPENANGFAPPYVSPESEQRAEKFIDRIKAGRNADRIVGINLSARGINRDWGLNKWEAFLKRITDRFPNIAFVLISVPSEREKGDSLEQKLKGKVDQIFPNANLTEVSSLLKRLDLLVSPDTSLVHIARSFKVPVIGLYPEYRKVYLQWLPYRYAEGLVLSYGGDNIFDIEVDELYERFCELTESIDTRTDNIRG